MINSKNATVTFALACVLAVGSCGGGDRPASSASETPLSPSAPAATKNEPQRTKITAALPDNAFRAMLTPSDPPATMKAGEKQEVKVHVKNTSPVAWPADSDGKVTITLRDRWLSADGSKVINDLDGGTPMVYDLQPGGEVDLALKVTAPKEKGSYILEFDMVQEQVAFFREKGSTPARVIVQVQ